MAFALRPLPASSLSLSRRPLGLGFQSASHTAVPCFRNNFARRVQPCLRCSAEEETETSEPKRSKAETPHPTLSHADSGAVVEKYGGWAPMEPEPAGGWKAGFMRVGAGFVLAIGVSLASYSWYSKQGKRLLPASPTPVQTQQSSSSKTSTHKPDFLNNNEQIDDELGFEDGNQELEEEGTQYHQGQSDKDLQQESQNYVQIESREASQKEGNQNVAEESKKDMQPPISELNGGSTPKSRKKKKAAGAEGKGSKVIVPAVVDDMQQQALAALQALKVVEEGVEPGAICVRREYARWLIATSSTLARSSVNKVFPAMYIEDATELAFDDVTPDDPDFPYIQGLAEAGLIPSILSHTDGGFEDRTTKSESEGAYFRPDSRLSRQDMVSWKVALERRTLPPIDKEAFQAQSGFIDVDRIDSSAWPSIICDLYSGDSSIIASAFGFTRRFQPDKPTTSGQAAVALASGDLSDQISEELARLQAEAMAEEAVAADAAMKARTQEELNALFDGELESERQRRIQTEKLVQNLRTELDKVKAEKEDEKDRLLKDKAMVESDKELLYQLKEQADEQLELLSTYRVEVSVERERLEKLRVGAEEDKQEVEKIKSEVDIEKKALTLARMWAEDEAKKARAHGKVLEEARKRWASQGIEVTVDNSFDEDDIPGPSWRYSGAKTELEKFLQKAPLQDVMAKGEDLKYRVNEAFVQSWYAMERAFHNLLQRIMELFQELMRKAHDLQHHAFSSAGQGVQETVSAAGLRVQGVRAAVAGYTSSAVDGTKRFADGCKGEADKLARRFKHD